jgi:gliding motility-associated-like protein
MMKKILIAFPLVVVSFLSLAQPCQAPGQTPSTAFPVCGTKTFDQSTVPICRTTNLTVPGCTGDGADYGDRNPYWYKFTCYEEGTLGFLITPKDLGDDYDWQLYDVTGHNVNDVLTNASLVVTANWAGTYGVTGASTAGVSFIQCASDPSAGRNSFSTMPKLLKGHDYLLLVSHYTVSQSGYSLSFNGGTAVITDPDLPHFKKVEAACSGDIIRLKLSKKVKCTSITNNGSEFFVKGLGAKGISSSAIDCSGGFDTDSVEIKLDQQLPAGNYQLGIQKGNDGNTLLDYCDNAIPETDLISFTVFPIAPTPMDSMAPLKCSPQQLKLIFRKPMLCSSIASDGSDFSINGTYAVAISAVSGSCSNGTTKEITLTLSNPLQKKGNFTLVLQKGSDGNTLLDECVQETPAGSFLSFSVKDTVNANFSYTINYTCALDVVNYFHPGNNEVNTWKWDLDGSVSTVQNPKANYQDFHPKNISLIVSNGFCSDTLKQTIVPENFLEADFTVIPDNCPIELIKFTTLAKGKIVSHNWSFGDGGFSQEESPQYAYQQPMRETDFQVRYVVTDSYGCEKAITKPMKIYSSCTVFVPNAFTPNGDGLNDFFKIMNGVKTARFTLKIFNRWGQPFYETKNWKQGWDGYYKGQLQATGTFVWMIQYTDVRSGKLIERKGTVTLIR